MYLVLRALLVVCVCRRRVSPEVTTYNHQKYNNSNTFFVLYASVVLVHQSCFSFIVL